MDSAVWNAAFNGFDVKWFLRDTQNARFLYCRQGEDRESFSFFFWAKPFDRSGWALLALSILTLTLVMKGNWLDVFGALFVRQLASSLDSNKTLILSVAASIVITCGYESIISSHVIIPPPVVVARNLKDLVGSGYKILGFSNKTQTLDIFNILRRENISHSSAGEPPFSPGEPLDRLALLSKGNVTTLATASVEIGLRQHVFDSKFPGLGIQCHYVKETTYPFIFHTTYSGYSARVFHRMLRSFQESGILGMLFKFDSFVTWFPSRLEVAKNKYREEKAAEVSFSLKDPKIISIFIGWGILLSFASITFLAEYFMKSSARFNLVESAVKLFDH
jgi:hypothetical protein